MRRGVLGPIFCSDLNSLKRPENVNPTQTFTNIWLLFKDGKIFWENVSRKKFSRNSFSRKCRTVVLEAWKLVIQNYLFYVRFLDNREKFIRGKIQSIIPQNLAPFSFNSDPNFWPKI